ncbi:MAG: hypothetical protein ACE5IQ_14595 [Candidatus Methylomirabilales bacterium]
MEERLNRLERENRRLKKLGSVALAVIAATVLMGYVVGEKVVEAERFVLLDPNGQPRAVLAVAKGGAGLYLYDSKGKLRAGLVGGTADDTGLHVYDQNGKLAWKAP